ncbi:MAG: hypothetical protein RL219_99 [Actinomycetota bacterium]
MDLLADKGPEVLDAIQRQLPSEAHWKLREGRTLRWWPGDIQQTITADAPTVDVDLAVFRLSITTRMFEDVGASDVLYDVIAKVNGDASGSALILDETERCILLHASFYIHPENMAWVLTLATYATTSQMAQAQRLEGFLQATLKKQNDAGRRAVSPHPVHGIRTTVDDMQAFMSELTQEADRVPRQFGGRDFRESDGRHGPDPSVSTQFDETGLTAEFPFQGRQPAVAGLLKRLFQRTDRPTGTALFTAEVVEPGDGHAKGCFMKLTLPEPIADARLINQLNQQERIDPTMLQGTGAWCEGAHGITYTSFLPSLFQRPGLFGLLYRLAALRAAWAGRFLA